MKRFFLKFKIKLIRYLRSLGYIPQPKRTYTYKGKTFPFYKAPTYATSEGKLYMKTKEFFQSVKFHKTIDRLEKIKF